MTTDYATARYNMVESQVRPNRVTDERIIDAMAEIPREVFMPKRLQGFAYIDEDIEVAPGRFIMEPMVAARMLQTAAIGADHVVLEIGCGTGYTTAVLARLAGTVVALESDEALAAEAGASLSAVSADNAIVVTGPLAEGYSRQAPYDAVVFSGAIPELPSAIVDQLSDGARVVAVLHEPGKVGVLTLWAKFHGQLSSRPVTNASVPMLPGFAAPAVFEFKAS